MILSLEDEIADRAVPTRATQFLVFQVLAEFFVRFVLSQEGRKFSGNHTFSSLISLKAVIANDHFAHRFASETSRSEVHTASKPDWRYIRIGLVAGPVSARLMG